MYSMKEVCEKVGMTYETLKYYCIEGLVPNVKRDKNNYRVFDENNVNWINSLSCLKKCGMSINDMKQYLAYCLKVESTIPERKEMLEKQKEFLLHKIDELNKSIKYIDWKQNFYNEILEGKKPYKSYLIDTNNVNEDVNGDGDF